jgi:hypothetical protein
MSAIPLHLQRRFEQRWVARFVSPAASAAPKSIGLKGAVKSLRHPAKVGSAGLVTSVSAKKART